MHAWYFDVPLLALLVFIFYNLLKKSKLTIPTTLLPIEAMFFVAATYALFISLIYGAQELFWAIKLGRMVLYIALLYFFFEILSKHVSYERFKTYVIYAVVMHSLIVIASMISLDFKHSLYSFTGFIPRGPEWSRSAGLTLSFNSPTIVHLVGLLFIMQQDNWPISKKILMAMLVLPSFLFMGRTMAYIGLPFLVIYFAFISWKFRILLMVGLILGIVFGLMNLVGSEGLEVQEADMEDNVLSQVVFNFNQVTLPLLKMGEVGGADSYYGETLHDHLYFSENPLVVLFGDSFTGPSGISGGIGETSSDIGLINSINANGIFITLLLYFLYVFLTYKARRADWFPLLFISLMSISLSFKETGLWAAHATPLLILIFFYQVIPHKRQLVKGE